MEVQAQIKLPVASHTFHKSWEQCPRKAWHSYIAKDVEREQSTAMAWGIRVHEVLEQHIKTGEPLPEGFRHYAHLYQFPPQGYSIQAELKLGIKQDGRACHFFDPDVYCRGVIDVVLLKDNRPDMAMLIDHKTGKVREDPGELELHAVLLNAYYPLLRHIKGWYNWLAVDRMGQVHDLSETRKNLQRLQRTHARIEQAFTLGAEAFPPRQGPLCGWCPVKQCEFHP